jgi:hypothetical protein
MRKFQLSVLFLFLLSGSLAYAGELRGTVVSVFRGEPLGKVRVAVLEMPHLATITAQDGTFRIEDIPPGKYTLHVSAVGYRLVTAPFSIEGAEVKEVSISMAPANFRRTDVVEVKGDIFQGEAPAVPSQFNLGAAEIKEASTVLADDPFRAVQSLPGVVATDNNDFLGEFAVLGAPFSKVSVYVDDVVVPHPFHSIESVRDGGSLSVFSSETVDELTLLPIAFPERYGDASGAALDIHTRDGSRTKPLFTVSLGLADSNFIGEGQLGAARKGSWLASARKSYLGYLVHREGGDPFTDIAFEDGDLKLSYDLSSGHNVNLYALDGHTNLDQTQSTQDPNSLKTGTNDFTLARLGWRFAMNPHLLMDTRSAYIRQRSSTANPLQQPLDADYYGEWVGGTRAVWSWRDDQILEAGYAGRRLRDSNYSVNYLTVPGPSVSFPRNGTALRQNGYVQQVSSFLHQRLHLMGGVRWDHVEQVEAHPVSPQISAAVRIASATTLQFGYGRYAQLPDMETLAFGCGPLPLFIPAGSVLYPFVERSNQYSAAVEQRLGENLRIRAEGFDRENRQQEGGRVFGPSGCGPVVAKPVPTPSLLSPPTSDYSRGVQLIIQRRSANRLSGWIGYTLGYARQGIFPVIFTGNALALAPLLTGPTPEDQRHTVNAFGTYRLTPSINLSAKLLFGSGLPVPAIFFELIGNQRVPASLNATRLGQYQRLDLRMDKAWTFSRWKMTLYAEGLNLTNHDNRRLLPVALTVVNGQAVSATEHGLPITPTAGLVFEF